MQIKCLLELNSVCSVPFNSARAFVTLGSWLVEGTKYVCRQGLLRMDLLLTVVGVENRRRISSRSSFYDGRHVTPMGCWNSVKQDHQFLNKISTYLTNICEYVIDYQLGKDDKDKRVDLKCQTFIWRIVHERFECVQNRRGCIMSM